MKINSLLAGTLALVLVAGLGAPAFADTVSGADESELESATSQSVLTPGQVGSDIDYILTGTGTGSIGQTNFVNADFTITVWANTADVSVLVPNVFVVKGLAAQIEIDGVGTATVTGDFGVFTNDPNNVVGFQSYSGNTPSADYYHIRNIQNNGYDLTTNFGPVFDNTPSNPNVNSIPTDLGNFFIPTSALSDGSFESQLKVLVGGDLLSIDNTALILAGAQSFSWMIPVLVAGIGIGLFVVSRKSE